MIYAVLNMKGGVGKTTTAVNLGAALGLCCERKVLVVDLDPQANATSWIGHDTAPSGTFAQALRDRKEVANAIGRSTATNVDLGYGSRELAGVADELRITSPNPGYALSKALKQITSYETILIDCPPGLGILSINAIIAADELIVPVDSQSMALSGLAQIQQTVQELVEGEILEKPPRMRILLTMYDARLSLDRAVRELIEKEGFDVFSLAIRTNTKLAEAYGLRRSIFDYSPQSTGAADYASLADLLATSEKHDLEKAKAS